MKPNNGRRLVVLESPFAGEVERNVAYAKRALLHSLSLGEAPIASHLLWTQPGVLDDNNPDDRRAGLAAGLAWHRAAAAVVFYVDLGVSAGMAEAEKHATRLGVPTEVRRIGVHPADGGDAARTAAAAGDA